MKRKLTENFRRNVWSSFFSAFLLSSSFFFLYYFQIFKMEDPPMRYSLADYYGFVIFFGGILFLVFFLIANFMTILSVYIKNVWFRLFLYLLVGMVLTPTLFPIFSPAISGSFTYFSITSLLIIFSILLIGICKEYRYFKQKLSRQ